MLNSWRSFEKLVIRVCPFWGGNEKQLTLLFFFYSEDEARWL